MNLDFSDDQKQLQEQVRRYLTEKCPTSKVREVLESDTAYAADVYKGLAELGALGVAIPEEYGGVGLSHLELCLVAEEIGRAMAPVPAASSIYLAAEFLLEAGSEAQKSKWLPALASGESVGCFAYAEGLGEMSDDKISATVSDGKLSGAKLPVADGSIAAFAVVAAKSNGKTSLFLVDLSADGVSRTNVETVDPTKNYAELSFQNAPAEALVAEGDGWHILTTVMDRAAVLLAFEQLGGADRALEMGRDYALERMAFGRPIGSFQAIKHMLADMYVSATLARSNCYYAAWALSTRSEELPVAAATARVSATNAFQHCAKNNIQVHGGMGFTWEFDCHLYYRRSNALALVLGSLSSWERELIARMSEQDLTDAA